MPERKLQRTRQNRAFLVAHASLVYERTTGEARTTKVVEPTKQNTNMKISAIKRREFAQFLKEFRERNRINQRELAILMGINGATVCHWEQGKLFPTKRTVKRVLAFARTLPITDRDTFESFLKRKERKLSISSRVQESTREDIRNEVMRLRNLGLVWREIDLQAGVGHDTMRKFMLNIGSVKLKKANILQDVWDKLCGETPQKGVEVNAHGETREVERARQATQQARDTMFARPSLAEAIRSREERDRLKVRAIVWGFSLGIVSGAITTGTFVALGALLL